MNKDLNQAKAQKNDEFYTQLADIETELYYYRDHFKGKTIFCNCDDPYESNFFKYFAMNFNALGLKKLIATCYRGSPIAYTELPLFPELTPTEKEIRPPYKAVITEVADYNNDGAANLADVEWLLQNRKNSCELLKGDGDFRSEECIELLKEADIVATNPPFSLFREYLAQLIQYKKQFIIIGNLNAIHYKEVFPLIKTNQLWLGQTRFNGGAAYFVGKKELYDPKKMSSEKNAYIKDGKLYWRVNGVRWFTNLDTPRRHEDLIMYKAYTADEYPHYFNYDAIDVSKVTEIPKEYFGDMGVPDTFLEIYNPEQFEIIGIGSGEFAASIGVQKNHRGRTDIAYYDRNGEPKCPYSRIIIRRKQ